MRKVNSLLAAVCVAGGAMTLPHLRVTLTDSMPRGIYTVTNEPVTRGAIVLECLPPELAAFAKERGYLERGECPGQVMPIMKRVIGVPGDEIELAQAYVAVNGRLILNSATREADSKGRPVPAVARGTFVLKPGEFFLLATNSERSWDGRYTGVTRAEDIRETVRPVWTEADNAL